MCLIRLEAASAHSAYCRGPEVLAVEVTPHVPPSELPVFAAQQPFSAWAAEFIFSFSIQHLSIDVRWYLVNSWENTLQISL